VFAGIWDHWQDDQGDRIDSCSIIVCDANQQMKNIHDRMPVILPADSWESWLTGEDKDALQALLVPYNGNLDIYRISRAVNSPKHDGPELLKPV
jgi:putative SOS response-associated peptidase YedK